jgi:hypothetical protein
MGLRGNRGVPTSEVSFVTRPTSSSRVRNIKFLSPEMMQRSSTWIMTGSMGSPGAAARTCPSNDARKNCVPGRGSASMSIVDAILCVKVGISTWRQHHVKQGRLRIVNIGVTEVNTALVVADAIELAHDQGRTNSVTGTSCDAPLTGLG